MIKCAFRKPGITRYVPISARLILCQKLSNNWRSLSLPIMLQGTCTHTREMVLPPFAYKLFVFRHEKQKQSMQPAGPHQLQLSKAWGNQEKLHNVGRLRAFAPNCASFFILQLLAKNVNCIIALYRDAFLIPSFCPNRSLCQD